MELNQLKYFIACVEYASLTKAAEALYTTQPHVSMVIKSLEKELGVTLFRRKAKGVELTEEGRRIYGYARDTLKNTELIYSACQKKEHSYLRIASNPSSYMAFFLTDYYKNHWNKKLSLQYTECGIEEMISLISDQEYNLGFLFVPEHKKSALFHMLENRRLEFVPLLVTDLVLYVGENHPLYGTESVEPEQLSELGFVQWEDDFFAIEDLLYAYPKYRRKSRPLNQVIKTNSNHMMIQMLNRTDLCNLGSYWLKDRYRQYDFGRIMVEGFQGKVSFGYISHLGRSFSEQEEAFLGYLSHIIWQEGLRK